MKKYRYDGMNCPFASQGDIFTELESGLFTNGTTTFDLKNSPRADFTLLKRFILLKDSYDYEKGQTFTIETNSSNMRSVTVDGKEHCGQPAIAKFGYDAIDNTEWFEEIIS